METFFKIFNDLFDVGVKRFTPVTEKNADLALMFVWVSLKVFSVVMVISILIQDTPCQTSIQNQLLM